jgi:hypothetical protein
MAPMVGCQLIEVCSTELDHDLRQLVGEALDDLLPTILTRCGERPEDPPAYEDRPSAHGNRGCDVLHRTDATVWLPRSLLGLVTKILAWSPARLQRRR